MATKPKTPGTSVILWETEMKAAALKKASVEKTFDGGKRINIQGGFLMIDDELVEGNSLDVVILSSVHINEYYNSVYTPGQPTVPVCYAFGDETLDDPEASMAPLSTVDEVQNPTCEGCWANQMGSADTGRGKACKNGRRLMVVTDDALESPEALAAAEERSINVPVMSVKNWAKYVKDVLAETMSRPCYGVVTTIAPVPDPKSQFKVTFKFKELINFDQPLWDAMKARVAGADKALCTPYPSQAELDAANAKPAAPARKGPPAKAAAKTAPAKKAGKY